ncbi:MAG TPA: hypothetical protein VFY61_20590, partial [Pyrinomonadaceae bacterium]|nr:hypothetical protein [Pyrinomonadaceae bacterium]
GPMNHESTNSLKPQAKPLSEDDCGDLNDNCSALFLIEELIATCRFPDALQSLRLLRNHIKASTDIKSRFFLLGKIEAKILLLGGCGQ